MIEIKSPGRISYNMVQSVKWPDLSNYLGNMAGRFFLRAFLLEEFLLDLLEICKCPVDEYFSP